MALLLRLIKGSIIGLLIGIFIYLFLDVQILKMVIGILIVMLTVFLILQITINRTSTRDVTVGGISGLLTTSIGVPGPPLLLYFSGAKIDKITLRSTTLTYYLFAYSASLVMQVSIGGTNKETWLASVMGIPALFIGIFLGQLFFRWISQETFRIITYIILLFTGVYLLISSF